MAKQKENQLKFIKVGERFLFDGEDKAGKHVKVEFSEMEGEEGQTGQVFVVLKTWKTDSDGITRLKEGQRSVPQLWIARKHWDKVVEMVRSLDGEMSE